MTDVLETIEKTVVAPGHKPDSAIIWLHGLGADGNDFVPIVPELGLTGVRYVFPHAPVRPVTLNNNIAMRAWFDLTTLDHTDDEAVDEAGLAHSVAAVTALIDREIERGIAAHRIVVAGFSQGGATALATALAYPRPLAALIGLSTWAPVKDLAYSGAAREAPVLLAHGEFDPVVAPQLGRHTRDVLRAAGFDVEWHEYPMAHAVCPQEIADIARFVKAAIR